jgi:hypothetical protein
MADEHGARGADRVEQAYGVLAREALAGGGRDNGPPGLRPQYHPSYYGAFVLDAEGNNVEAVTHGPE